MSGPGVGSMLLIPWLGVVLLGLVVMAWGVRGRMVPQRGRCSRCRQELHDPFPSRCGECGADLARRDGISWGQVRPRVGLLLTGVAMIVLSTVGVMVVNVLRASAAGAGSRPDPARLALMSDQEFEQELARVEPYEDVLDRLALPMAQGGATDGPERFDDSSMRIWSEIEKALVDGTLAPAQRLAAAKAAGRHVLRRVGRDQQVYSSGPLDVLRSFVSDSAVSSEDLAALVEALTADLVVHAPSRVVVGDKTFLVPHARLAELDEFVLGATLRLVIGQVSRDGRPVAVIDGARPEVDGATRAGTGRLISAVVLKEEGAAELDVEVWAELGSSVAGALLAPGVEVASAGGAARRVPLTPRSVRIEAVATEADLPQTVSDPGLMDQVRSAIVIERLTVAPDIDGRSHVVQAVVRVASVPQCALAFEVAVLAEAGPGAGTVGASSPLGTVEALPLALAVRRARANGWALGPSSFTLMGWADEALVEAATASIRLTPIKPLWLSAEESTPLWTLPLDIDGVPIVHLDASQAQGARP